MMILVLACNSLYVIHTHTHTQVGGLSAMVKMKVGLHAATSRTSTERKKKSSLLV